jgi:glycerophosphoryl diester phosphodiesterase
MPIKYLPMMLLSALTFFACKITETKPVAIPAGFDWQGHRGARGLMPENSVPAFLHALDFPQVTTLELDLAVSKDKKLIVSHEPFFNPAICLNPNGAALTAADETRYLIYELTAEQIKGFDCGSIGNPRFPQQQKQKTYKPTLEEVVKAVAAVKPGMRWNIEIKSSPAWDGLRHPPVQEFAALVIAELRRLGIDKRATVQSFDVRALQAMHQQAPDITLAYLVENGDSFAKNLEKLGFTPPIFSPYYLRVNRKLVRQCREKNIQLIPWTVNDVQSMRRLIRLGVQGIITDYPDKIKAVGK